MEHSIMALIIQIVRSLAMQTTDLDRSESAVSRYSLVGVDEDADTPLDGWLQLVTELDALVLDWWSDADTAVIRMAAEW